MSNIEIIKRAVLEGIKTALKDIYAFTDNISHRVNAEYLFTVNIAKSIANENSAPCDPYSVSIEKNTDLFTRECFQPIKDEPGFKGSYLALEKELPILSRKGRIDVVVYGHFDNGFLSKPPICAIELKGVNPRKALVFKDWKRNAELLNMVANTGISVLEFTLFSAVHAFKNPVSKSDLINNETKIKNKYSSWVLQMDELEVFEVEVDVKTLSSEISGSLYYEADELAIDTSTKHQFIAVMVSFS